MMLNIENLTGNITRLWIENECNQSAKTQLVALVQYIRAVANSGSESDKTGTCKEIIELIDAEWAKVATNLDNLKQTLEVKHL